MLLMWAMAIHAHNIFTRSRAEKDEAEIAADHALVEKRLARIANPAPAASSLQSGDILQPRKSPRKPVYLKAQLRTENYTRIRCHVVDLSADGARVALDADHEVTPFVTLKFERSGVAKKARVAWRHNNELGLAFKAKNKPAESSQAEPTETGYSAE